MRKSRGLTGGGWILWFHFSEPLRYPAESCSVNHTIKRIVNSYNADERLNAAREGREPLLFPEFSCHHLRHTFATRLCEVESNLKVIQSIMGHKNIETTMDVYAEATDRKKEATFENLAAKLDELF